VSMLFISAITLLIAFVCGSMTPKFLFSKIRAPSFIDLLILYIILISLYIYVLGIANIYIAIMLFCGIVLVAYGGFLWGGKKVAVFNKSIEQYCHLKRGANVTLKKINLEEVFEDGE